MAILNTNDPGRLKLLMDALGANPKQYQGIFQGAYEGLNQPKDVYFRDQPGGAYTDPGLVPLNQQPVSTREALGRGDVIMSGTKELAEAFVDRYYEKTGKLPDQKSVQDFVAGNLTEGFAENYILGKTPREQIKVQLADPFIKKVQEEPSQGDLAGQGSPLEKQLTSIYDRLEASAPERIARTFAPLRSRAIEEEAALGRLRSPVSAAPGSPIQQQDQLQANALSDTIDNILQNRASGSLDVARIDQEERRIGQQAEQFGQNLSLQRDALRTTARQQSEANRIAQEIGRLTAQGRQPGTLDYLNTAFGGASALAGIIASLRPKPAYSDRVYG